MGETTKGCSIDQFERPKEMQKPENASKKVEKGYKMEVNNSDREARYDGVGHLPEFDSKNSSSRCKRCHKKTTHVFCVKCNVNLCFVKDRNCFMKYHLQEEM